MASIPPASVPGTDRDRAAPVMRRQLLTTRGSQEAPPRVVLHLPDLDALSAVAIGPPRPAERRRVDPPHTVVAERHEEHREERTDGKSKPLSAAVKKQLFDLAKAPVGQLYEQVAPGGKISLPRLILVLQSPKILLAAVAAIGLQFAAILAMFTGGTVTDPNAPTASTSTSTKVVGAPDVSLPSVSLPATSPFAGASGPIQTPLSAPNSFAPSLQGLGSPTIVAQPSLPPPQSLPGLKPGDVPPWGDDKIAPLVATPSPTTTAPIANAPATLAAPTLPISTLPTSVPAAPSLPNLGPTVRTTPAVQTSDAGSKKPKARLQGTIKKASITETAP